jgi:hypothetical protein
MAVRRNHRKKTSVTSAITTTTVTPTMTVSSPEAFTNATPLSEDRRPQLIRSSA